MKRCWKGLLLLGWSLFLVACQATATVDIQDVKSQISKTFKVSVNAISDQGSTNLSNGEQKLIFSAEGVLLGVIEKDGQLYSMYAGNRIRNYLNDNLSRLGIANVTYPVAEFHSLVSEGYGGARLLVSLEKPSRAAEEAVLAALETEFGQDLSQAIHFGSDYPSDFLDEKTAIWLEE